MDVEVLVARDEPADAEVREVARRRARFALRRFLGLVYGTRVVLATVRTAGGAVHRRCRVFVETYSGAALAATADAPTWQAAIEEALRRAVRRLRAQSSALFARTAGGGASS